MSKVKYIVLRDFKDLKDGDKIYTVGDTFPHEGSKKMTTKRINELKGSKNKHNAPIIKEVPLTQDEIEELEQEQALEEE
ncbi:hypothetical protein [Priestia megaterium]|uniref:hypothetical protein n=1 Tax=Priestia megaterium TaxID=1404 RepID=UPI000BFBEA22|nr:hypothetical protein [Priestia megaterium]PGR01350.1 hypothetical protein COA23_23150 [Priestia megaterium]